jgi:hypothetical protein
MKLFTTFPCETCNGQGKVRSLKDNGEWDGFYNMCPTCDGVSRKQEDIDPMELAIYIAKQNDWRPDNWQEEPLAWPDIPVRNTQPEIEYKLMAASFDGAEIDSLANSIKVRVFRKLAWGLRWRGMKTCIEVRIQDKKYEF